MSDVSKVTTPSGTYDLKDASARSQIAGLVQSTVTDSIPTASSGNLVTSGGVYSAISPVSQKADANEQALQTLNGTGAGSVKKTVADEVAKVVADAPEAYNTLKEISDWISTHESSAAAMNSAIQSNSESIGTKVTGNGMSIAIVDGNIARLTYS